MFNKLHFYIISSSKYPVRTLKMEAERFVRVREISTMN